MKATDLQAFSNEQLQEFWNSFGSLFDRPNYRPISERPVDIGLFQLQRETTRRGLEITGGRFGQDIILIESKPEKQNT